MNARERRVRDEIREDYGQVPDGANPAKLLEAIAAAWRAGTPLPAGAMDWLASGIEMWRTDATGATLDLCLGLSRRGVNYRKAADRCTAHRESLLREMLGLRCAFGLNTDEAAGLVAARVECDRDADPVAADTLIDAYRRWPHKGDVDPHSADVDLQRYPRYAWQGLAKLQKFL